MGIRLLSAELVSRIAAGEVIERPASVVKELIENSLDAGAGQIAIEVNGGGTVLIRVSDNGSGIPPDELELAFRRHATSKLSSLAELESIATLGFRGEALASIAAAANVELVSAAAETDGHFLVIENGSVVRRGRRARPRGTTIEVRQLFAGVPVRLKFLRSAATEQARIAEAVTHGALANPAVRFSLVVDGRAALGTPGSGRLLDTVAALYGNDVARAMLPVSPAAWSGGAPGGIGVEGLAGAPSLCRASRDYITFFVNRRWVSNRLLAWALENAYQGMLMTGRHPVAVLNITLPPGEVDVNVHPAKTEVRFRDERAVIAAVQRAVRRTLIEAAPVPQIQETSVAYGPPPAPAASPGTPGAEVFTQAVLPTPKSALPALRLLGQLALSYIIAEGPEGLYLVDQHAAHERVLFERLLAQGARGESEVQALLEPALLDVSPAHSGRLREWLEPLAKFGFRLEPFGAQSYLVRAVPALLSRSWRDALHELLDSPAADVLPQRLAVTIACHAAVRAGQALSDDEMRALLRDLESAAVPHSCPHGRPTLIRLELSRLRRDFGRT